MRKRIPYSQAEHDFLTENQTVMRSELTKLFNAKFNRSLTKDQIKSKCTRMGLKTGRKAGYPKGHHRAGMYTKLQLDFLSDNRELTRAKLAAAFNAKFNTNKSAKAIGVICKKHKFLTGRTGKFEKGFVPFNKGVKGWQAGGNSKKTQFKKGSIPANAKPVGYERISKDGYKEICIDEINPHTGYSRRFVLKRRYVWEQHNGPIPENHVIIYKNSELDIDEIDNIENLVLVSRREHLHLNYAGHNHAPKVLKPTIRAIAKLKAKTSELLEQ